MPPLLAVLAALGALAAFAHRTNSRDLVRPAVIAIVLVAVTFAARIAIGLDAAAEPVLYVISVAGTAVAYRIAQPAVHRAAKLTDVFS